MKISFADISLLLSGVFFWLSMYCMGNACRDVIRGWKRYTLFFTAFCTIMIAVFLCTATVFLI